MKIPFKRWCYDEAERLKVHPHSVARWVAKKKFVIGKIRRVNARVVLVDENEHIPVESKPTGGHYQFEGEIQLIVFIKNEAAINSVKEGAIYMRIHRGKYPELKLRRVNQRVIFVSRK